MLVGPGRRDRFGSVAGRREVEPSPHDTDSGPVSAEGGLPTLERAGYCVESGPDGPSGRRVPWTMHMVGVERHWIGDLRGDGAARCGYAERGCRSDELGVKLGDGRRPEWQHPVAGARLEQHVAVEQSVVHVERHPPDSKGGSPQPAR